ncbi:MAG: tRNA (adenosine(37)-N6)-threonylcarbamoyltransferase complex dimerization subunit type 1 TsaB [Gemmataceae bacterium]|nr:tRNA (adenosine(37)-N6)-threonylcarbamoyltransferase complex dimerization subunit type 1 TsaB [Gemmataceae bacterium]
MTQPRLLLIETSQQPGVVAVAVGSHVAAAHRLDEARRHARDLAPAVAALLQRVGWRPRDLEGVVIGRGPGSYTGLRVGIMSAKALAYAVGCPIVALGSFDILVRQVPGEAQTVDVVADAQQDQIYVQRFQRMAEDEPWTALRPLAIVPWKKWVRELGPTIWVTGPGLRGRRAELPVFAPVAAEQNWQPWPESLAELGSARWRAGVCDDVFQLEPLYLRPSSAEVQWGQGR